MNLSAKILVIISITVLLLSFRPKSSDVLPHEAYMSVTKIEYNEAKHLLEFVIKITAHDLEKSLRIVSGKPVILDNPKMTISNNEILKSYLSNKLLVQINGTNAVLNYIGYEIEVNDNAWIYCEIPCPDSITNITLSNLLLTETFSMQQNVTHLNTLKSSQSFVFTKAKPEQTFIWNE